MRSVQIPRREPSVPSRPLRSRMTAYPNIRSRERNVSEVMTPQARVLEGPVRSTLLRMAGPMALGMISIILSGVVDTFFIGRLGQLELAAMSFVIPFSFAFMSILMGLGVGTSAVLARIIGQGDQQEVRRVATDSLLFGLLLTALMTGLGLLIFRPVFFLMRAEPALMPFLEEYMTIWLLGLGLLVIPMVGNSILRATGDTKSPGLIMGLAALINFILDPILIFGWGPVPAMGMSGAAIATVLSWLGTFLCSMWILHWREGLLVFTPPHPSEVWRSWRRILFIGLPASGTNLLLPVTTAILTGFVASHGMAALAAFAVGGRIETLSMIGVMAMASVLTPFVGQNQGAGRTKRVRGAVRFGRGFSLLWGSVCCVVLFLLAEPLASLFSEDAEVRELIVLYLRIVPISYGCYGISMVIGSTFNGLHKPWRSGLLILCRLFLLTVPLAYLGGKLYDLPGLFGGMALANVLIGLIAVLAIKPHVRTS